MNIWEDFELVLKEQREYAPNIPAATHLSLIASWTAEPNQDATYLEMAYGQNNQQISTAYNHHQDQLKRDVNQIKIQTDPLIVLGGWVARRFIHEVTAGVDLRVQKEILTCWRSGIH